jgi:hypothetical protein
MRGCVGGIRRLGREGKVVPTGQLNAFGTRTRVLAVGLVAAAALFALFAGGGASPTLAASPSPAGSRAGTNELLPDLNPLEPRRVMVQSVGGTWLITFGTATDNLGAGPLMVHASRSNQQAPFGVDQEVEQKDGSTTTYRNVGQLVYVVQPDHQHWHFLGFMTYELRDVATYGLVRPSQKTGFCLLDDYDSSGYDPKHNPPNKPAKAVYTSNCAKNQPDTLSIDEGISVGYGDYYNPLLEGQSIDLTGVRDGRYYLIVRSNQAKTLREADYTNNAGSDQVLISRPSGPNGPVALKILSVCRDADRCLEPLSLKLSGPRQVARSAPKLTVKATLSEPSAVDVRLRVGGRVLSHLRKRLPAGSSNLSLAVPSNARPGTASLVVQAAGPGLLPAAQTLSVQLR